MAGKMQYTCCVPIATRLVLALTIATVGIFCLVGIARGFAPPATPATNEVLEIAPDVAIQAALSELFKSPDKAAFERDIGRVRELTPGDETQLISQLLWFAARRQEDARTKPFVGQVLTRSTLSRHEIMAALAPHLDNRDDAIQSMAKELLRGYEDRSATRPPDFSAYRDLIEAEIREGREPQTSLVRFMFESDPGTALQTMVRAVQLRDLDEIKAILWSEHVVAELFWKRRYGFVEREAVDKATLQELEKLVRHPRWWVRLYVAEIVRAHPELRSAQVVKPLKQDVDARVRESVNRGLDDSVRPTGKE
jgi:hypothetical protein